MQALATAPRPLAAAAAAAQALGQPPPRAGVVRVAQRPLPLVLIVVVVVVQGLMFSHGAQQGLARAAVVAAVHACPRASQGRALRAPRAPQSSSLLPWAPGCTPARVAVRLWGPRF